MNFDTYVLAVSSDGGGHSGKVNDSIHWMIIYIFYYFFKNPLVLVLVIKEGCGIMRDFDQTLQFRKCRLAERLTDGKYKQEKCPNQVGKVCCFKDSWTFCVRVHRHCAAVEYQNKTMTTTTQLLIIYHKNSMFVSFTAQINPEWVVCSKFLSLPRFVSHGDELSLQLLYKCQGLQ